jgi:translation initiation factor 2 subunit 1
MEFPETGEIVICRITRVLDYGVFAELLDFEGVQGFVHISQVSSSWVKNIRNFVKEGQMRAAKVNGIDPHKKQADLSLNQVSPRLQKTKINEYKSFKRTQKLIEVLAKEQKTSFDEAWEQIAVPLMENHDSLYDAFEQIKLKGETCAQGIPKKWIKPLIELIEKNIESPQKTISGTIELHSPAPNGVELLKESLNTWTEKTKGKKTTITYTGSGKFNVTATSHNFKESEKILREACEECTQKMKSLKGESNYILQVKKK